MKTRILAFLRDKTGVTAIEYGLIAALVGVAIIGGVTLLGASLDGLFGETSGTIETATSGAFGGDNQ